MSAGESVILGVHVCVAVELGEYVFVAKAEFMLVTEEVLLEEEGQVTEDVRVEVLLLVLSFVLEDVKLGVPVRVMLDVTISL